MRVVRRIFVIFCFLATCMLVWSGVYTRKQGFTKSWRDAIEGEFADRGWHVDIGKITLGAFRGLVAEDVTFYETSRRVTPLGSLDDVYLDVDLSRIFQKEISVNTLDVEKARLSLPLDPSDPAGARLEVTNLSGRVVVSESMIELVSASADVEGFELRLKGSLLKSEKKSETGAGVSVGGAEEAWADRRQRFLSVIETLRQFEFLNGAPVLTVEFRGDLRELSETDVTMRIRAERIRKKGQTYEIAEFEGLLRHDGKSRRIDVEELIFRDARGDASFSGIWEGESNRVSFDGDSSIDLSSFLGCFRNDPLLQEIVFFDPPDLKVEGHLDLARLGDRDLAGFPGRLMGEFQADRFVTRGRVFSGIDFGFNVEGENYYLRNLRVDHKSGVAFLNLKHEPGLGPESIRYQAEIKLDPNIFRPFLGEEGRKFLDAWTFDEESTVYLAAAGRGSDWNPATWENRGVIDLRNFKLKEVEFLEMEADFESQDGTQWFRDISLVREEGKIHAEVARHDVGNKLWEVSGVVSTVDIQKGAGAFSPKLASHLAAYRFASPPTVRLEGTLDARRAEEVGDEPRRSDLRIEFESPGNARYEFLGEPLDLENGRGKISVKGSRVHLSGLEATTLGGSVKLDYEALNVRSPLSPFVARLEMRGVPLEGLTGIYGGKTRARGKMAGFLNLSGDAANIASYRGDSRVQITDGNLFAIPVLGPLSKAISHANPEREGAGYTIVREASATIRVENGVLLTEDLEALAESFEVRSAGSVSLVTREVDLEAVVNTRGGLSRAILTPVSELLTFSCTGTIDDPVWKSKHISNLGKVPSRVITEITNVPVEGLKAIGKGLFGEKERTLPDEVGGVDSRETPAENARPRLFDRLRQTERGNSPGRGR